LVATPTAWAFAIAAAHERIAAAITNLNEVIAISLFKEPNE
jgi:hypothetical protein